MSIVTDPEAFERLLNETERKMSHCPEFGLDQALQLHMALQQMRPTRIPVCHTHLIMLIPDRPYVFFVDPACPKCVEHARRTAP